MRTRDIVNFLVFICLDNFVRTIPEVDETLDWDTQLRVQDMLLEFIFVESFLLAHI